MKDDEELRRLFSFLQRVTLSGVITQWLPNKTETLASISSATKLTLTISKKLVNKKNK
jgi:hypothetical protein